MWVRFGWNFFRGALVLVGIIMLTSFTIDATDTLSGSQSALSLFARKAVDSSCPAGMLEIGLAERSYCIDIYENSFTDDCPLGRPMSAADVQTNINDQSCGTQSVAEVVPAVFTTFHQAQTFCARRGGRLPSSLEWFEAALGTPDGDQCNLDSNLVAAGSYESCVSARGAVDMVGNAWEWIDAPVENRVYDGATLPPSGYVTAADRSGVAMATDSRPDPLFNKDYFWSLPEGRLVMMRGGFYRSGDDGGIYSVHADMEPSFTSAAIGFRCVIER